MQFSFLIRGEDRLHLYAGLKRQSERKESVNSARPAIVKLA